MTLFHTPRPNSWQVCIACGEERLDTDAAVRCSCGGLLDVRHRAPESVETLRDLLAARLAASGPHASGVWRYHELIMPGVDSAQIVTHPEGNTPLLTRPAWSGSPAMNDSCAQARGSQPDRIVQGSRHDGRDDAGGPHRRARGGLRLDGKHGRVPGVVRGAGRAPGPGVGAGRENRGRKTGTVPGVWSTHARGSRRLRRLSQAARLGSDLLGIYLLNSINPFRLEGQKTIVSSCCSSSVWEPPDWIVLPAGNLGNTSAFGKALVEARGWGLISKLPRIAAIQAAGAAPFAQAFAEDFRSRRTVEAETVATAIRIGDPASWDRAVRAIRATDGVVLSVTDAEILEAKSVVDRSGVGCEPASAASVAGVRRLVADGTIKRDESVVAVLHGTRAQGSGDPAQGRESAGGNRWDV